MKITIEGIEYTLDVARAMRDCILEPVRVPQPGEVWEFAGELCLVLHDNRYTCLGKPLTVRQSATISRGWEKRFVASDILAFLGN